MSVRCAWMSLVAWQALTVHMSNDADQSQIPPEKYGPSIRLALPQPLFIKSPILI